LGLPDRAAIICWCRLAHPDLRYADELTFRPLATRRIGPQALARIPSDVG
jgi:hypothetical protein